MAAICAWAAVTITIAFLLIKATVGLRVSEEKITGLDSCEHGVSSAYAGFGIMDVSNTMTMDVNENMDLCVGEYAPETPEPVTSQVAHTPALPTGIYKVRIISPLSHYDRLKKAMNNIGVTGMTVTQGMDCGIQKRGGERYRGVERMPPCFPR